MLTKEQQEQFDYLKKLAEEYGGDQKEELLRLHAEAVERATQEALDNPDNPPTSHKQYSSRLSGLLFLYIHRFPYPPVRRSLLALINEESSA